jgi:hypothetical protein
MDELVERNVYEIQARNFAKAVYAGGGRFVGIRKKFETEFLDVERHHDADERHGTVRPVKTIGVLPEAIQLQANDHGVFEDDALFAFLGQECVGG